MGSSEPRRVSDCASTAPSPPKPKAVARVNRGTAFEYYFPPGGGELRGWLEATVGRRADVAELLRSDDLESKVRVGSARGNERSYTKGPPMTTGASKLGGGL